MARWERGDVKPSLETLLALIRACGLELTFGLANYDDSYDEWIERYLSLPVEERIEQAFARAAEVRELQAAAAR